MTRYKCRPTKLPLTNRKMIDISEDCAICQIVCLFWNPFALDKFFLQIPSTSINISRVFSSMERIERSVLQGHNALVVGQPGTGKTELLKKLADKLVNISKTVQLTASTGIASASLNSGMTIHKFTGKVLFL